MTFVARCWFRVCAFFCFLVFSPPAPAASLEKAEHYMELEKWSDARKQYSAVIRKGGRREREEAYLGLALAYVLEKDFRGAIQSLRPLEGRIPESNNGAWMHVWLFKAARAAGDMEAVAPHYQALFRNRTDFSLTKIAEHLMLLKKYDLVRHSAAGRKDSAEDTARRENFRLAESLMGLDITRGAARLLTMLAAGRPDEVGRPALLRLGQALEAEGDWTEAERCLKLYVLLFPEDPGAADALHRLARGARGMGSADGSLLYTLAAEFYPATLFGAISIIDRAWTWPTQDHVRAALRAIREAPGLPEPVFERGLAIALTYPHWLASDPDRAWAAQRYKMAFPR